MINKALFTSKNQGWNTPKWLFDELNEEFHFQMDVCTTEDNPLGTPFFCWKGGLDGLKQQWIGPVYCNPPYGRKNKVHLWLEKAIEEQNRGITSVFLLPSRTGTTWFHDYIYDKPNVEIRFLKGRLRFDSGKLDSHYDKDNSAPFDSMIVIFRPEQV